MTVKEIKRLIAESSSEFKPVLGASVEAGNKENNEKSYKDSEKRAKDYDGGLKEPKKHDLPEKQDYNRTTLDYNPVVEPSKEYKERINAQLKGYTSKAEEKNGIEKCGEFDKDGKIGKWIKNGSDKINDEKADLAHSGLQARMYDKKKFEKNTMYENAPKAKRLTFKRTKLLNESQVLNRIPEQYKTDGQIIHVCDCLDNEYIVECVHSKESGMIETNVISHTNKRVMNEQLDRIHQLMNYSEKTDGRFDRLNAINEQTEFGNILNIARGNK